MTASDYPPHPLRAIGIWPTIAGAGLRHWLIVALLTLGGLLLAGAPFLPNLRDRVYLWLQSGDRPQKSVVVVAIDDQQFFGPLAMSSPIDRDYIRKLLTTVAETGPAVIALDISLSSSEKTLMDAPKRIVATTELLKEIDKIASEKCPVVLPKTIMGSEGAYVPVHDVFDGFPFTSHDVAKGFTSTAEDVRRIPIRVKVGKEWLDSFAYAVFRAAEDEEPGDLGRYAGEWPYSFFFSKKLFTPRRLHEEMDELTATKLLSAKPQERQKWLHAKIVLIGGDWHQKLGQTGPNTIVDAHATPRDIIPGVTTHANYVQSLLWGAMRPMWGPYRVGIELLLGFIVSFLLLRSHRWRRLRDVVAMIAIVVFMTWYFSRALGVFFEMVIPIGFLGIHVLNEEFGQIFHLSLPRSLAAHPTRLNGFIAAVVAVMAIAVAALEHQKADVRLNVNDRLEVVESAPEPPAERTPVPPAFYAGSSRTYPATSQATRPEVVAPSLGDLRPISPDIRPRTGGNRTETVVIRTGPRSDGPRTTTGRPPMAPTRTSNKSLPRPSVFDTAYSEGASTFLAPATTNFDDDEIVKFPTLTTTTSVTANNSGSTTSPSNVAALGAIGREETREAERKAEAEAELRRDAFLGLGVETPFASDTTLRTHGHLVGTGMAAAHWEETLRHIVASMSPESKAVLQPRITSSSISVTVPAVEFEPGHDRIPRLLEPLTRAAAAYPGLAIRIAAAPTSLAPTTAQRRAVAPTFYVGDRFLVAGVPYAGLRFDTEPKFDPDAEAAISVTVKLAVTTVDPSRVSTAAH